MNRARSAVRKRGDLWRGRKPSDPQRKATGPGFKSRRARHLVKVPAELFGRKTQKIHNEGVPEKS